MEASKEFVSYEDALELKKLGFNEPCFKGYTEDYKDLINFHNSHTNESVKNTLPTKPFTAPLYQQAFRFFREKYSVHGWVKQDRFIDKIIYRYFISRQETLDVMGDIVESYEEAELACLRKLIEIAKNND